MTFELSKPETLEQSPQMSNMVDNSIFLPSKSLSKEITQN